MNSKLIEQRFKNSLTTYDEAAIVQNKMAETLLELLPKKEFLSILEIGCGTGVLTRKLVNNLRFESYIANDIVSDCSHYVSNLNKNLSFLSGDITELDLNKAYDLIISNAVFQWFKEPHKTIKKLKAKLNPGGILLFSSFGSKNFYELKEIMGVGLDYPQFDNICQEELVEMTFDSTFELIKHIKNTGANAIQNYSLTKIRLQELDKKFIESYGKVKLTYHPIFSSDHAY